MIINKIIEIFKLVEEFKNVFDFTFIEYDKTKLSSSLELNTNVKIFERKNIGNDMYKLIEITKWSSNNSKHCVILGFNPTSTDINTIDNTNVKLINELYTDYDSVILLNNHILKSKSEEEFSPQDELNEIYNEQILPKILELLIENKIDVIIFWGRTNSFNDIIDKYLRNLCENNLLYYTVKKKTNSHYHPGRCSVDIKPVDFSCFDNLNYLK